MLTLGKVASRMAAGGVAEKTRRIARKAEQNLPHVLLTRKNAALLADKLSRLRGAAMKLGQMLSLEGDNLLPAEFARALEALQANADRMPKSQVEQVLKEQFGADWPTRFADFDFTPIASASIGQVHRATARDGRQLALKVQYPGVAQSVDSDVDNLIALIRLTKIAPSALDLDELAREVKRQLKEEVDYLLELKHQLHYQGLLRGRLGFKVPESYADYSTQRVLATELVEAPPLLAWAKTAPVEHKSGVARRLLELLLLELFHFRFMQTDPNPGNYLFDTESGAVVLLDFGAARAVPDAVSRTYREALVAVASRDREGLARAFSGLGVIHAELPEPARNSILDGALELAEILAEDCAFDFAASDIAERMHGHGKELRRHRRQLKPPPLSYLFFQRKLGGAFLLSRKLEATVNCHRLLYDVGVLPA